MKYTAEEALSEIMCRSGQVIRRRQCRRSCQILLCAAGTLFAALILVVAIMPGGSAVISAGSAYGAFLLSPAAGGYVLAAVIAFALGIVVTLLCLKYRKSKNSSGY